MNESNFDLKDPSVLFANVKSLEMPPGLPMVTIENFYRGGTNQFAKLDNSLVEGALKHSQEQMRA
jgi:hypothetical protein